mmetsp:Transcript_6961/g.13226  ORF Transcript_6961/g.13226 Transcript_6961/m.13226 type:complete len:469 (+) Transcript_6961:395-1801(+)
MPPLLRVLLPPTTPCSPGSCRQSLKNKCGYISCELLGLMVPLHLAVSENTRLSSAGKVVHFTCLLKELVKVVETHSRRFQKRLQLFLCVRAHVQLLSHPAVRCGARVHESARIRLLAVIRVVVERLGEVHRHAVLHLVRGLVSDALADVHAHRGHPENLLLVGSKVAESWPDGLAQVRVWSLLLLGVVAHHGFSRPPLRLSWSARRLPKRVVLRQTGVAVSQRLGPAQLVRVAQLEPLQPVGDNGGGVFVVFVQGRVQRLGHTFLVRVLVHRPELVVVGVDPRGVPVVLAATLLPWTEGHVALQVQFPRSLRLLIGRVHWIDELLGQGVLVHALGANDGAERFLGSQPRRQLVPAQRGSAQRLPLGRLIHFLLELQAHLHQLRLGIVFDGFPEARALDEALDTKRLVLRVRDLVLRRAVVLHLHAHLVHLRPPELGNLRRRAGPFSFRCGVHTCCHTLVLYRRFLPSG